MRPTFLSSINSFNLGQIYSVLDIILSTHKT